LSAPRSAAVDKKGNEGRRRERERESEREDKRGEVDG